MDTAKNQIGLLRQANDGNDNGDKNNEPFELDISQYADSKVDVDSEKNVRKYFIFDLNVRSTQVQEASHVRLESYRASYKDGNWYPHILLDRIDRISRVQALIRCRNFSERNATRELQTYLALWKWGGPDIQGVSGGVSPLHTGQYSSVVSSCVN